MKGREEMGLKEEGEKMRERKRVDLRREWFDKLID